MKSFIDSDFLLQNKVSRVLYHDVVKHLPIIDYHNHINIAYLVDDKSFQNLTALWIKDDPYKHRAMRINGIPEDDITGDTADKQKFLQWIKTVPKTIGNPLYHWSHLEMQHMFGFKELINSNNAETLWDESYSQLSNGKLNALSILQKWNIELFCTSDDLLDDISGHEKLRLQNLSVQTFPSLRGDSIINIANEGFSPWLKKLEAETLSTINTLEDYKKAVFQVLGKFDKAGCLLADHALDDDFDFIVTSEEQASLLFSSLLQGKQLSREGETRLKSYLLSSLGKAYARFGWALQLHIGAHRQTSTRLSKRAGKSGGYACIGKCCNVAALTSFLDELEKESLLPKTILFTLNPADNQVLASITGSYSEDGVPGKIQFGPAWWYNDHLEGLQDQLSTLANYGLIGHFIGMTTDSRSLLSFSRHDYFRRVLCRVLGKWADEGLVPDDMDILRELAENIAYKNIKNWLNKTSVNENIINK